MSFKLTPLLKVSVASDMWKFSINYSLKNMLILNTLSSSFFFEYQHLKIYYGISFKKAQPVVKQTTISRLHIAMATAMGSIVAIVQQWAATRVFFRPLSLCRQRTQKRNIDLHGLVDKSHNGTKDLAFQKAVLSSKPMLHQYLCQ